MPSRAGLSRELIAQGTTVPAFGATGFPAGHVARNVLTGDTYTNIGNSDYSMHVADGVNYNFKRAAMSGLPVLVAAFDLNATFSDTEAQTALWADRDFVLTGTNAVAADITASTGGGWSVPTHGGATDAAYFLPPAAGSGVGSPPMRNPSLLTQFCPRYAQRVVTSSAIVSMAIYAGLKLTATHLSATDDDQAYFLFDTGNTNATSAVNWQFCTSRGGTDTFVDTGVAVAASTSYDLLIQVDGNRCPRAYINGALVAIGGGARTGAATGSTNVLTSAVTLLPSFGVKSLATASAKTAIFRPVTIGRKAD